MSCALIFVLPIAMGAAVAPGTQVVFGDSIVDVPKAANGSQPHIVRELLTAKELAASMDLVVSLRMRNFAELQSRVQAGQLISQNEMEEKYLPIGSDYDRVTSWLIRQGFTLTLNDRNHTNVFVRGSVSNVSTTLNVSFARVATGDGEFSSAVTAPELPEDISGVVLGVGGLQPHLLMHTHSHQTAQGTEVGGSVTPADVLAAYNAPISMDANGKPINGTGQTIGIIMDSIPLQSDLTAFWQAVGANESISGYTLVSVNGGPTTASQSADADEVALDTEWATGMAPGANLRVYAIPSLTGTNVIAACAQILNDNVATVVSYSAGGNEIDYSSAGLQAGDQTLAQLAAAGITFLASSGDGGSNPNPVGGPNGYNSSNRLSVNYPASDPLATGVGGTTTTFDSNWNATTEAAWSQIGMVSPNPLASGGGLSSYFPRPSWQAGSGVPTGVSRCVPDVAAVAQVNPLAFGGRTGGFVILNGQQTGFVGTSLASPIWAGVVALLNQYRVSTGLPNIGFLNRWIYGLNGTDAFNDTTIGNNGAYLASPGYDLCTGIGSPNITNLINRTEKEIFLVAAPANPVGSGAAVTMSVTPQFLPSTYQWQLNGINIYGATGSVYAIPAATTADSGNYTVVISNAPLGALTYSLGTLSVGASITTTPSPTRLTSISTRAQVGTGGNILIPGFTISGSGHETLLIRGDGPALAPFGVSGVLAQPSLSVFNSAGTVIASNTGWGTNSNPTQIAATAASVGAFALSTGSADCALIVILPAGAYTVQISGLNNTTGVALAEIYEISSSGTRLEGISTRAQVGTGANIIIPGFSISGSGSEQLLVRGDGPGLTSLGVTGVLTQPSISLFDNAGKVIASNTAWGTNTNPTQITSVDSQVGAFALASGSADSALVTSVPSGAYTLQLSGVNGSTGDALAEIYEVP